MENIALILMTIVFVCLVVCEAGKTKEVRKAKKAASEVEVGP